MLARRGAAGRTYKVPHFESQFQESGNAAAHRPSSVRGLDRRFDTQTEVFATSDHSGHDLADTPLKFGVVGYWAAYRDFARKVRMNAAADQLRRIDQ